MRYLFCGSRTLDGSWTIWNALQRIVANEGLDNTIVHGGARGADETAGYYAERFGLKVEVHMADWGTHGKAAGPIRNKKMLDSGVDAVYAFTTGTLAESKGTANMVAQATKAGVPTSVKEFA